MPDADPFDRHPEFCFYSLAIENRQSKIEISCGGIAQLVERQLCKLEVRGSNPLASKTIGVEGIRQFSKRSELLEIELIARLWRRKRPGIPDNSIRPR